MKVHRWKVLLGVFLLPLLLLMNGFCQGNEGAVTTLQKVDQLLSQGGNQQALQLLQQLPEGTEKLWRMARVQYEMGRIAESTSLRMEFFRKVEKYARAVITMDSKNSEGYKWLAIGLGAQSKYSTTRVQIHLSTEIKENIEKSIELNPADDMSYLVLSRWHYKISELGFFSRAIVKIVYGGLPKASLEKSESLLWHAINLHDRIAHRHNLAKVYDRMGRREDAIEQLRQALSLPVTFPEEIEELGKVMKKLQQWQKQT